MEPLDPVVMKNLNRTIVLRNTKSSKPKWFPENEKIFTSAKETNSTSTVETVSEDSFTASLFKIVEKASSVNGWEIQSALRRREISVARGLFCYIHRHLRGTRYPKLGKILRKDHTSCVVSVNQVRKKFPTYHQFHKFLLDKDLRGLFNAACKKDGKPIYRKPKRRGELTNDNQTAAVQVLSRPQ